MRGHDEVWSMYWLWEFYPALHILSLTGWDICPVGTDSQITIESTD